MDALIWKKLMEIKNQKMKTAVILAFPFLVSIVLIIKPAQGANLAVSLPLFNIMICWLLMFSVEDFAYAEVVFGAGIDIWKMWRFNLMYIIVVAALYTGIETVLFGIVGAENCKIGVLQLIISFCCGCGLICFATCYISDYSKVKNYISSAGGIFNIILLGYICMTYGKVVLLEKYLYILFIVSVILALVSVWIVYKISRVEKFVNNIKKLSDSYENKNFIDE